MLISFLNPSELSLKLVGKGIRHIWDIENDTFIFRLVKKETIVMRRGILSLVSSIIYQLDILTPANFEGKLILQNLSI